ncbi:CLCA_X family protein [Thalassolituus pacificus]|uniref:Large polyvalent protein-associated domain-containing protein n=1 Tax=Thalassolituus pacificus TaxID=2975440 RepID=A0A9X2WH12_9GAMM|nr:CLCA_X family protein [Thalassolituus pacificus]MCT7360223.1 hypothetical protein [Thalassolituus pacificus]
MRKSGKPTTALTERSFYRAGPDHRSVLGGVIPDFLTIRQLFDFRGVEIGRWVKQSEQEYAAACFYDALCDLTQILAGQLLPTAKTLRLRRELISLRGTLALQYGRGGRPGVSAHYSPLQRSFALAKNAGPGSIAHEWFHAFDHYMAAKAFSNAPRMSFASALWLQNESPIEHPLNALLGECYKAILLSPDGKKPSRLFIASTAQDKAQGSCYYSQPEELCARAFEAFIQDAVIKNAFLVKGSKESAEAQLGLYPQDEQRRVINLAFGRYFSALSQALLRQPADPVR